MSRPLRIVGPGLLYHLYARGNGRMVIFTDDRDRQQFLELLAKVVRERGLRCHAFCEMDTHFHLVATTTAANLSQVMKDLDGGFAEWWNDRHAHVGHVFQGRFGAKLVQEDAHLLTAVRYVIRNPVRGGLVDSPEQWPWSSCRATCGLVPVPSYLDTQMIWQLLGGDDRETATRRFREFVSVPGNDDKIMSAPVIGDADFARRFSRFGRAASREVPDRERQLRPSLDDLFRGAVTRQRRIAASRCARAAGHSISAIARFLDLNRATVRGMIVGHAAGRE